MNICKKLRKKHLIVFGLLMLMPLCVRGATNDTKRSKGEGTNNVGAELDITKIPWTHRPPTNTFGERFQLYFVERIEDLSETRLHPFNTMRLLSVESQTELDDRRAQIGVGLVRKSFVDGLREELKDVPIVDRALHQDSFLARLFRDSIGNTEEEDLEAGQISYTTNEVVKWEKVSGADNPGNTNMVSRWKRMTRNLHPRHGLRWDYAYVAFTVGQYHRKPIMFGDVRYRYGDASLGDILATDMEALLSFPLGDKAVFNMGIVQKIDPPDWSRRLTFKIVQKLEGARIFFGVTVKDASTEDSIRYVFGFEKRFR